MNKMSQKQVNILCTFLMTIAMAMSFGMFCLIGYGFSKLFHIGFHIIPLAIIFIFISFFVFVFARASSIFEEQDEAMRKRWEKEQNINNHSSKAA